MPLRALLDRALRHEDRVRADGPLQPHPHVLVGTQDPLGVVNAGADQERPGLRVEGIVGKGEPSGVGEDRSVDQDDLHDVILPLRLPQEALAGLLAQAMPLVFGDAEIHPDGREHGHRGQEAVLRADVGALGLLGVAGDAGYRRGDHGVGQIQFCGFDLGLGLLDGGLVAPALARRVVEILPGQGVLFHEGLDTGQVRAGRFHGRLLPGKRRLGLV